MTITIENACTNCQSAYNEVNRLILAAGVGYAIVRWPLNVAMRNNLPLAFAVGTYLVVVDIPRYRNGVIGMAQVNNTAFDADVRVGDVYEVIPFEIHSA